MHQMAGNYERGTYQKGGSLIHIENNLGSNWTTIKNYHKKALALIVIE